MRKLALGIISIAAINTAVAQPLSGRLDSVVISGNRIEEAYGRQNRNIEVLDSRQIKALPVKSTNELLSYVAGVDLRQRGPIGTQADVSIDGSTFDQVLVLINGVKMSDLQTGHHMLNIPIPINAIERIEIVRGPAARTYGVNALAGAINIVTKTPVQDEVLAQAYAGSSLKQDTATGETYYGWGAQASAAIAAGKHSHILSLAHDEGRGFRYNTAYDAYRLFYQNRIAINEQNNIEAMGGYINNSFGANAYYAAPVDKESTEAVETAIGSIRYNYQPNKKLTISPRVSYRYNNDDYIFVKQKPELYHNIHETNVLTGELQGAYKTKNGIIGAGVEYRAEHINSTNLGKRNRNNLGIFAEYKHYFSDRLNAGAGLYANKNSDYDWEVFPGVDAGYYVAKNWKLFVNATSGQRLPTYTDLYYKGPANIGNAQLKPEYAYYAEGGVQHSNNFLFARASYFYRRSADFIDWVRAVNTDPWQPQNFQTINTQGISLLANFNMSEAMEFSDNIDMVWNANYTYLSPVIDAPTSDISKYAIEALRHQATIKLTNTLWQRVQTNIAYRYLYRINANDYTLVDARIGYMVKNILLYIDVNNLLDTQYKEVGAVPMPGRWYTLGVRFNHVWK